MHFQVVSNLNLALPMIQCSKSRPALTATVERQDLDKDEHNRLWIYDTGAGTCMIGKKHLTAIERKRVYQCSPQSFVTGAGLTTTDQAVQCKVPYLGTRECYVLSDCPPLISVKEDVTEFGNVFVYSKETGPRVHLSDGTTVYLDDSQFSCPQLSGYSSAGGTVSNGTGT